MADEFTVGELRECLSGLPDDTKLSFHAGLTFYRIKRWGDDEVMLEFNEFEADLSPGFRKQNPDVVAAFCRSHSAGSTYVARVPRL